MTGPSPAPVTPRTEAGRALLRYYSDRDPAWKNEFLLRDILAIEREAAAPAATEALDVERLLEAWVKHMKRFHPDDDYDDPTYECAKDTVAHYARL